MNTFRPTYVIIYPDLREGELLRTFHNKRRVYIESKSTDGADFSYTHYQDCAKRFDSVEAN